MNKIKQGCLPLWDRICASVLVPWSLKMNYIGKDQANGQFQDSYLDPYRKPSKTKTLRKTGWESCLRPVKPSDKNSNIHLSPYLASSLC